MYDVDSMDSVLTPQSEEEDNIYFAITESLLLAENYQIGLPQSVGIIEITPSDHNVSTPGEPEPIVEELYETPRIGRDWHTVEALFLEISTQDLTSLSIFWRLEVRERQPRRRTMSTGERIGWLTGNYSVEQVQESRSALYYAGFAHSISYAAFALCHQLSVYPPYTDFEVSCALNNIGNYRAWL
jgi:hypothetical protein